MSVELVDSKFKEPKALNSISMSGVKQQTRSSVSQSQSVSVMKNIIRVSISNICFLRNIFEANSFQDKRWADMDIKALRPQEIVESGEIVNKDAVLITRWLEEGVFEALEKKYLRCMMFGIYQLDSNGDKNLIECYTFKVSYPDSESVQVKMNGDNLTSDNIRNQAIMLVRTLVTMCNTLSPLPGDRYLTMKLYYYEDITPLNWQPTFLKIRLEIQMICASRKLCLFV